MKKMQLAKFRDLLVKDKEAIALFISNHSHEIDHLGDETDAIQAKIIARSNAQIVARNRDKLLKIDFALKKIAAGDYGNCEECDEPIAEKRLMFNPSLNTCIGCAERLEIIRKSQAR